MSLIRPFAALRPLARHAAEVAAPPYDVLSSDEARERARGMPWSFLHVSKAEIDLPASCDPHSPQVYARAALNLRAMIAAGVMVRDLEPGYYIYRLIQDGREQTGIACAASVEHYEGNRIRRHELTRPDKETDRVMQIEALGAHTGPVMLAYPTAPQIDALLAQCSAGPPSIDLVADDGVRHTLWTIVDPAHVDALTAAFDALPALYIADGHHRSAAAARVAAARRPSAAARGTDPADWFLAVAFPHHAMRILDYNRVVHDLGGLTEEAFLQRLQERFDVEPSSDVVRPSRRGEIGLRLPGRWFRLGLHAQWIAQDDPIARLDVSLLTEHILAPILGIHDLRKDTRIDFVGGGRGLAELERRVAGGCAAAFALYPTSLDDLMAVADRGAIMPPKSTWFEPKLADGLVSLLIDDSLFAPGRP